MDEAGLKLGTEDLINQGYLAAAPSAEAIRKAYTHHSVDVPLGLGSSIGAKDIGVNLVDGESPTIPPIGLGSSIGSHEIYPGHIPAPSRQKPPIPKDRRRSTIKAKRKAARSASKVARGR